MKFLKVLNNMKRIFLITTTTLISLFSFGQFEGTVKYSIEYTDIPEEMQGYESMMAKDMTMLIKDENVKIEQQSPMGGSTVIINSKTKTVTTLFNMMGKKVGIEMNDEEIEREKAKELSPEIEYLDETKKIAGYSCKKAIIKSGNDEFTVYYTNEIQNQKLHQTYKGLDGFLMEYEVSQQGMGMIMSVTEIEKKKIAKNEFEIPAEYDLMTKDEFNKMMSGQMMGK